MSGNEGASEELLKYNSPMRVAGAAGAWQKASLQVPRAEQPLMALPELSKGYFCEREDRTPVPPPRRKRPSAGGTAPRPGTAHPVRAPPPRPPAATPAPPAAAAATSVSSKQLLSPPKPRPVNTSTVSLPEWRDLQRPDEEEDDSTGMTPRRPASASPRPTLLRPPSVSSVSDATLERVGTYLRRCRSFGNMSSSGLVDKLSSIDADSDSDVDPWEGVDDFEHTCGPLRGSPPHTPRSRVDRRKISAPGPTRKVSETEGRKRKSGVASTAPVSTSTPNTFASAPDEEISTGRFFISSAEDDWFNRDYHRAPAAPPKEPEGEISEVKKELQSIIYNYNRTKKISTSSMNEVLPTQPVRVPKRKKISVASITPPPSPMSSDVEEDAVPESAVINGEEGGDATAHSTLLRLLRECQSIEGALEDMTQESDMPSVHHALRKLSKNNHHLKEREIHSQVTQSHDSGLDVRGTLDRATPSETNSITAPPPAKNADSGVDEDEGQASRTTMVIASVEKLPGSETVSTGMEATSVKRRHPDATVAARLDDDAGSSSGRSSMTPSLSELEAALSDMLEKSAADEDDRASPLPAEQVHVVSTSATAATLVDESAAAKKDVAEVVTTTGSMLIPKISVTSASSPSVH